MHVTIKYTDPINVQLQIEAESEDLHKDKQKTLLNLRSSLKVAGFRNGKAPLGLVEKNVDQSTLHNEFLENSVNRLYLEAINEMKLRPVNRPTLSIKKFVPFTQLEIEADVEVVGKVELPNYHLKLAIDQATPTVGKKEINEVLISISRQAAKREESKDPLQVGDEAEIDFKGFDAASNDPISGADGKNYPLLIGSDSFIPGFETNLVGLQTGEVRDFELKFPSDYGVKALQNRQVRFEVTVNKIHKLKEPQMDDALAKQVGPFKSLQELKTNIKKQLLNDKKMQAQKKYENEVLEAVTKGSKVDIPPILVEEELNRMEDDERQALLYRGQTWQEHLVAEGITSDQHREKNRTLAQERVKAGLVLSEVAERENITVSEKELYTEISYLKQQYTDQSIQNQLDSEQGKRDIKNRILASKTMKKLADFAKGA